MAETPSRIGNCRQTQLEEDSDGETSGASPTGVAKQQKQRQQSSLPAVKPEELSPLEQKRALRLEMLTRMIGEVDTGTGAPLVILFLMFSIRSGINIQLICSDDLTGGQDQDHRCTKATTTKTCFACRASTSVGLVC